MQPLNLVQRDVVVNALLHHIAVLQLGVTTFGSSDAAMLSITR